MDAADQSFLVLAALSGAIFVPFLESSRAPGFRAWEFGDVDLLICLRHRAAAAR